MYLRDEVGGVHTRLPGVYGASAISSLRECVDDEAAGTCGVDTPTKNKTPQNGQSEKLACPLLWTSAKFDDPAGWTR